MNFSEEVFKVSPHGVDLILDVLARAIGRKISMFLSETVAGF